MTFVTRKLKYTASAESEQLITQKRKMYGSVIRSAAKYVFSSEVTKSDGMLVKNTKSFIKDRFIYSIATDHELTDSEIIERSARNLDVSFLENAVMEGIAMGIGERQRKIYLDGMRIEYDKKRKPCDKNKYVFRPAIYGTRNAFKQLAAGEISKEEFADKRLPPISFDGRAVDGGNRKADFRFNENEIILKFSKKEHAVLDISSHHGFCDELLIVQEMVDLKLLPITWSVISHNEITLSYELSKVKLYIRKKKAGVPVTSIYDIADYTECYDSIQTRHAGMDLNPSEIGLAIVDRYNTIYTDHIDISALVLATKITKGQDNLKATNRLNNRLEKIAITIVNELVHYKVTQFTVEDLDFKVGDQGSGAYFNKTMSSWPRQKFMKLLQKQCENVGIKFKKVKAHYSSLIGNLVYELPDPICAAREIARRGYETSKILPDVPDINLLANRWKDDPIYESLLKCTSWKAIFAAFNKSKTEQIYRCRVLNKELFVYAFSCKSGVRHNATQHMKHTNHYKFT